MQTALNQEDLSASPARIRSDHKTRDELLLMATSRFCATDTISRLNVDQFKEAFYLLIGEVTGTTKQIVARLISTTLATPRPIALYFALEPLIIARPVLLHSAALGQLDMMRIIEMKGTDYARLLAQRPDIGPSVVKRLREFDDAIVGEILRSNKALVNGALPETVDSIYEEIHERLSLSSTEERVADETTVARRQSNPVVDRISSAKIDQPASAEAALLAAATRGGRLDLKTHPDIQQQPLTFDIGAAFEKAARAKSHQAMAVLMQKRFQLSFETAQQVLEDKSGDTLAVLMRAADVEAAQANRIQLLINPTIGLSVHNAMRSVRFYSKLRQETCMAAVEQWPKQAAMAASHQPVAEEGHPVRKVDVRNAVVPQPGHQARGFLKVG